MTASIDNLLGIVACNLIVFLIVRRTSHLVTIHVVGIVVQRVTTSLEGETCNHGIGSFLRDALGSVESCVFVRLHPFCSVTEVGNQRIADNLTVCYFRIEIVGLIGSLEGEGDIAPVGEQFVIEHCTHNLGFTHHLGQFGHVGYFLGHHTASIFAIGNFSFHLLFIEFTVLQVEDEFVGSFYADVKCIPEAVDVAGIRTRIETCGFVARCTFTGVGREVNIAVQLEILVQIITEGASRENLCINTIQCSRNLAFVVVDELSVC